MTIIDLSPLEDTKVGILCQFGWKHGYARPFLGDGCFCYKEEIKNVKNDYA